MSILCSEEKGESAANNEHQKQVDFFGVITI